MRQFTRISAIFLLALGCTESTQPNDPARDAVVLTAASPTRMTIVAGNSITDLPTVIAQDANGVPRAGVVITFALTSKSGRIAGTIDTTNSSGIAQLGQWIPGTKAGDTTTVMATAPSGSTVLFATLVSAGPPARFVKIRGDNQVGVMMTQVPITIEARLTDAYDNSLPKVQVRLSVRKGGGTVDPDSVQTDSTGAFAVSRWTLGEMGEQVLVMEAGNAVQSFRANAVVATTGCTQQTELVPRAVTASLFNEESCKSNGVYFTRYYLTIPATSAWAFEMRSSAFDSYLELMDANMKLIARNDNFDGSRDSRIPALLLAGTYQLIAYSKTPNVGGAYSLSFTVIPPSPQGCEELFAMKGDSAAGTLLPITCNGESLGPAAFYRVHLAPDETIMVTVRDQTYSGYKVDIMNDARVNLASAQTESYYTYTATYTADSEMDVIVKVTSDDTYAGYTISFR